MHKNGILVNLSKAARILNGEVERAYQRHCYYMYSTVDLVHRRAGMENSIASWLKEDRYCDRHSVL